MSDKPILDQAAHVAAGALCLAPVALWFNPLSFALSGAAIGFVREISEGGAIVTREQVASAFNRRSLTDIAFWSLGGLLIGMGVYL